MRKLPMSAGEIAESYRTAKNQEMQVGVLADLNLCTREEMEDILVGIGVRERKKKAHRGRGVTFDTEKARRLWEEGKNDAEIADTLGIPVKRLQDWRRREGMMIRDRKAEKAGAEDKDPSAPKEKAPAVQAVANESETRRPVSVKTLRGLLDEAAAAGYDEAPVTVEGQMFSEMHLVAQRVFGAHEDMTVELEGAVL